VTNRLSNLSILSSAAARVSRQRILKPMFILCLAFALSSALCGCFSSVRANEYATNAEPQYQGRLLSGWLSLYHANLEATPPSNFQVAEAVRHIGTNALPWLLQWIRSEQPDSARLGVQGIGFLGTEANVAIPELTRLLGDWQSASAWSNAISALALLYRDGLPPLLPAATNMAAPPGYRLTAVKSIRRMGAHMNGMGCLANLGTNAPLAVPVLIRCLQDEDWRVAAEAAAGLGDYTLEPGLAVPALVSCLLSRTNPLVRSAASGGLPDDDPYHWQGDVSVRFSAVDALHQFCEAMRKGGFWDYPPFEPFVLRKYREAIRHAVPALVRTLSDEDWRVATQAAGALGEAALEPDMAVPALVKSLDHPQPWVRTTAAEALGKFGATARQAVPALGKAQHDPDGMAAWAAANALREIAPNPARKRKDAN
jgi:HEAT repeat protein